MKRRSFLGTIGIGLATTAGCIGNTDDGAVGSTGEASATGGTASADDEATDTSTGTDASDETATETATEQPPDGTPVASGEEYERRVGSGTLDETGLRRPHRIAVRNSTTTTRSVTLTIRRSGDDVFADQFALEPDAVVGVVLTDLDTYEVDATRPESEATESVTIGPDRFTCNVTQTSLTVETDGTLSSGSISTLMACPGVVTERIDTGATTTTAVNSATTSEDDRKDEVTVENPTERQRTARILVRQDERVVFDGCYTLDAGATARLTLSQTEHYQIETTLLETGATETTTLDCNSSSTRFVAQQDGTLTVSGMSTRMACLTDTETESS